MTEEFDAGLRALLGNLSDDPSSLTLTSYDQITGGYSRVMARVRAKDATGERGYIIRSDPPGEDALIDTDRATEWSLISAIHAAGDIPVPAPLWADSEGRYLGCPTLVFELIDGPSMYTVALERDPADHLALALDFADLAATIHRFDVARLPATIARPSSWDDYIDQRIELWLEVEAALPSRDPFIRYAASWLRANKPADGPLGLVHGDLNPNNAMMRADGSLVMVDWELAHVGDPREDLGYLALIGTNQPPDLLAADPAAFYARYREQSGLAVEQVNPTTVAYFTVLGATDIFLGVTQTLARLARDETASINAAYSYCAVSGMHNVFMNAIAHHSRLTRGAA